MLGICRWLIEWSPFTFGGQSGQLSGLEASGIRELWGGSCRIRQLVNQSEPKDHHFAVPGPTSRPWSARIYTRPMLTTDREIEPEDAGLRERQRELAGAERMTAAGLRWLT